MHVCVMYLDSYSKSVCPAKKKGSVQAIPATFSQQKETTTRYIDTAGFWATFADSVNEHNHICEFVGRLLRTVLLVMWLILASYNL